ncbi:MAG: hypothetical protein WC841_04055 [Candidatus Shapirobacteria bacterium]
MNIKATLNWLNRREHRIIPKISPVLKFLIIAFLLIGSSILTTKIKAQEVSYLEKKQDARDAGGNNERWTMESLGSISTGVIEGMVDKIPEGIFKGEETSYIPGGMVGSINRMTASLYIPQASGIQYIAQLKNNLLGKPAYAQGVGIGFNGLQPILPLWRGFRNVVYLISSFLFVIIGIMIMLRVKISPQAVITIQSAIPQVIITLILVTFSYAIAGLIIDLSIFLQSFGLAVLYQATGKTNLDDNLIDQNFFGGILKALGLKEGWTFKLFSEAGLATVGDLMLRMAPKASLAALGGVIGAIVGGLAGPAGALTGGTIGAVFMLLVIVIAVMIWQVKFYFGLVKCYVTILFQIITAPFVIGIGAFPNVKTGFSTWLLQLVANISVFPISLLFLVLANIIIDNTRHEYGIWKPQLLESGGLVGFMVNLATIPSGGLLPVAVGLASLMLLSKLPDMIPQYIFMIKPSPWGVAIGESTNLSKNPIARFGKSFIGNKAATSIADPKTGASRGIVGGLIEGTLGPGSAQAASDAIRNVAK